MSWKLTALLYFLFFALGFAICFLVIIYQAETPPVPGDILSTKDIHLNKQNVTINLGRFILFSSIDSGSMRPLFDGGHEILVQPMDNASKYNVGDIIVFEKLLHANLPTAHQVIEKGIDNEGVYYLTKGYNNIIQDPFKVRPEEILGRIAVIIY